MCTIIILLLCGLSLHFKNYGIHLCHFFRLFAFSGADPVQHVESPRLGVQSEL